MRVWNLKKVKLKHPNWKKGTTRSVIKLLQRKQVTHFFWESTHQRRFVFFCFVCLLLHWWFIVALVFSRWISKCKTRSTRKAAFFSRLKFHVVLRTTYNARMYPTFLCVQLIQIQFYSVNLYTFFLLWFAVSGRLYRSCAYVKWFRAISYWNRKKTLTRIDVKWLTKCVNK